MIVIKGGPGFYSLKLYLFQQLVFMTDHLDKLLLGCSSLAGLFSPLPPATATATISTALMLGVRNFDTAPHYGCGLGEERLGSSLAGINVGNCMLQPFQS